MTSGLVGNIQRYSIHDGPGIRTTVFLKGCPLACTWCHNPENRAPGPELALLPARCIRCGACTDACPEGRAAPAGTDFAGKGTASGCVACGACVEACPVEARQLAGRMMTAEEILTEILKDRTFYEESGGGVTLSGGEPFVQAGLLLRLLDLCREQEIHTAVDTCGYTTRDLLLAAARRTGIFLYDLKATDDARHRLLTGVSNRIILDNLRALAAAHGRIWIRIPVVPGLNDAESELESMAQLAASLPAVEQVNLLPYHRAGLHKSERLGQKAGTAGIIPPAAKHMESIAARFRAHGIQTMLGG